MCKPQSTKFTTMFLNNNQLKNVYTPFQKFYDQEIWNLVELFSNAYMNDNWVNLVLQDLVMKLLFSLLVW